jgi:hypothetical protein
MHKLLAWTKRQAAKKKLLQRVKQYAEKESLTVRARAFGAQATQLFLQFLLYPWQLLL